VADVPEEKGATNCPSRRFRKKVPSFRSRVSFHGIPANQLGSDQPCWQTASGKARGKVWKDERRCCEEMDIFSSRRVFFHIDFHSYAVRGNILFFAIVPHPISSPLSLRRLACLVVLLAVHMRGRPSRRRLGRIRQEYRIRFIIIIPKRELLRRAASVFLHSRTRRSATRRLLQYIQPV